MGEDSGKGLGRGPRIDEEGGGSGWPEEEGSVERGGGGGSGPREVETEMGWREELRTEEEGATKAEGGWNEEREAAIKRKLKTNLCCYIEYFGVLQTLIKFFLIQIHININYFVYF